MLHPFELVFAIRVNHGIYFAYQVLRSQSYLSLLLLIIVFRASRKEAGLSIEDTSFTLHNPQEGNLQMADAKFAFRSQRLVYRSIENNDADKEFIHKHIDGNPEILALNSANVLKPQSTEDSASLLDNLKKSLLGVMICIAEDDSKSTPIGYLCLGFGGFSESQYRHHHRTTELGISIAAAHQGKGYRQ